jgi:DNA primase catalytic core, N-terminal domain
MLDIRKFADKYKIEVTESGHHHIHTGWAQMHCPFCAGGRTGYHLGFSLSTGAFSCWRCGALRFWKVLTALVRHVPEEQLRQAVAGMQTKDRAYRPPIERLRVISPPPGTSALSEAHKTYLRGRQFDPETLASMWGIQGTGYVGGSWAWRVVFPVRNGAGHTVAWQGRAIGDNVPQRYKNTEDALCLEAPEGLVYGLDMAYGDTALLVEGATGAWRLGPGTLATLGISWNPKQADKLRRFKRRFVLYDPEPLAQKRAREVAEHLGQFPGETEILSGFDTDPGDFPDALARKIRRVLGMPPLG